MSIVIIGGNERMVCQYSDICKDYGCKAKVFPKEHGSVRKKIGCPDLLILFTSTVSHKMIRSVLDGIDEARTSVVRCHTSSKSALTEILENHSV